MVIGFYEIEDIKRDIELEVGVIYIKFKNIR